MATRTYDERLLNGSSAEYDDGTLGFDWGGLIGGGIQAGVSLLTKPKTPTGSQPLYEGYAITAALDQMWTDWAAREAELGPSPELLAIAQALKSWLADTTVFDSRAIASNAYIANSRRQIDANIARLQGTATTAAGATQTATGQTSTAATADDGQIIDGISNTTLLLAAAAIGGIFLMTRGN